MILPKEHTYQVSFWGCMGGRICKSYDLPGQIRSRATVRLDRNQGGQASRILEWSARRCDGCEAYGPPFGPTFTYGSDPIKGGRSLFPKEEFVEVCKKTGAGKGIWTLDPRLGKAMLYHWAIPALSQSFRGVGFYWYRNKGVKQSCKPYS